MHGSAQWTPWALCTSKASRMRRQVKTKQMGNCETDWFLTPTIVVLDHEAEFQVIGICTSLVIIEGVFED